MKKEYGNYVQAFRQRVLRELTDARIISIKLSKALDKNTVGWVYGLYKDLVGKNEALKHENMLLKDKIVKYEKIIRQLTLYAKRK